MKYKLGLYEKSMPNELSIKEKLQVAKSAGFDYLELSIDESDEKLSRLKWAEDEIKSIKDAMSEIGLPIRSICLSGHRKYPLGSRDEAIAMRSMEIMEQAVILASKLGVAIIQLAGYDVYYEDSGEETVENFSFNLQKAALMAATEGIILGFETMETPFLNTVEKAMFWVNKVNSPYLQVYPDIGNLTNASKQNNACCLADLSFGEGHIVAVHLKETLPGVYREVPYGKGHVDFEAMIKQSIKMGVRMFVGEFWYVGDKNWEEIINRNSDFLREAISKSISLF